MNGKYRFSIAELVFCYSMGFIIFLSGFLLFFGTIKGVEGCSRRVEPQRMLFFTEIWIANCSTVQTWYGFGIVSVAVGLMVVVATIIAQLI